MLAFFSDRRDNCPQEWGDGPDGCPIPDKDGDGILDLDDQCEEEPENYNGIEDSKDKDYLITSHILDNYYESFENLFMSRMGRWQHWNHTPIFLIRNNLR